MRSDTITGLFAAATAAWLLGSGCATAQDGDVKPEWGTGAATADWSDPEDLQDGQIPVNPLPAPDGSTEPVLLEAGTGDNGSSIYQGGERLVDDAFIEAMSSVACDGESQEPEPESSVLMLVVDVSGSMTQTSKSSGGRSKWEVTHEALSVALGVLPPSMAAGMLLYPNRMTEKNEVAPTDVSHCITTDQLVGVDLLGGETSAQRTVLGELLANANVMGGTPTHDAYDYALQNLVAFQTDLPKYMLLITDGQPTFLQGCFGTGYTHAPVATDPVVDAIATARTVHSIPTFVIGSPGSEQGVESGEDNRPWLSMAAEVGGTARAGCSHSSVGSFCHFDLVAEQDFSVGLQRALGEIAASIVDCTYTVPEAPNAGLTINTDEANVIYTNGAGEHVLLLRDDHEECGVGWQYNGQARESITLCQDSCRKVKSDPKGEILLLYGCSTAPLIPE